jgi:phosphatidylserine decarboxylase
VAACLQYLLPRYWLTALVHRLARVRAPAVKNFLIRRFTRLYGVDTSEVRLAVPGGFATFNDFFVRELAPGARPVDPAPGAIVSPVDGTVSQAGAIEGNALLQAKGMNYALDELLAAQSGSAGAYRDGAFATLYLAPHNYHRVHAPCAAGLRAMHYVPGDLFSVNAATAARVRGLFRRNERLILEFATDYGPAALIFVGALNVGSITTPWTGEIRPRRHGVVETLDPGRTRTVDTGELLGWFNLGSTVILLFPPGACEWHPSLQPGSTVRMGQAIGRRPGSAA